MLYYIKNGLIGSIINDCHNTGKAMNVTEEVVQGVEYVHPYEEWARVDQILVYRTNREIQPGEEILTKYEPMYREVYYNKGDV